MRDAAERRGIMHRYREHLPITEDTPIVSLGEGDTPLIFSERLSHEIGAAIWLKYEGANPTGSFKDRGMTVAISKALEQGSEMVMCASTGNTSASAAAYAARAGLSCAVLIPQGSVALGKLAQALVYGAKVIEIEGNFDRALEITEELAASHTVTLVNSVNPHRIEGQKTAAFEVVEALGDAPQLHVMPVGNAGNITAYWRGYREAQAAGWSDRLPVMYGFQAEGSDPIVRGHPIATPTTVASAIRIGNPASWSGAIEAAQSSGGAIRSVPDDDIVEAFRSLAHEGLFVELASAAAVAGLRRLAADGILAPVGPIVCILTGNGLKDPDWALSAAPPPPRMEADAGRILDHLELT
jgi:threonine synthase